MYANKPLKPIPTKDTSESTNVWNSASMCFFILKQRKKKRDAGFADTVATEKSVRD
jgi:hypothetical protein